MKVLVVGSGGREHALAWKIAQSPECEALFVAPGNPGTERVATNVPLKATDIAGVASFALREKIDLVVVGPEQPLVDGLADVLRAAGVAVFGPSQAAARLEGSKAFSKEIMTEAGVLTARYAAFTRGQVEAALAFVDELGPTGCVVKADGLAAGKGVFVCETADDAKAAVRSLLIDNALGGAGGEVVVEERLDGEEASFLAVCDGERVVALAGSQDHKRAYDGDLGPNTGGMGTYSPAPVLTAEVEAHVMEHVMRPVVARMAERGTPFVGLLYAGLMIGPRGVYVLEFNARFGDPETQPLMMRLESDLLPVLDAAARGRLDETPLQWHRDAAVCVVMASKGYPATSTNGCVITGLEAAEATGATVFHAGTAKNLNGEIVTSGGRVLGVTARGATHAEAIAKAYGAVELIDFDGAHFRRDIAARATERGA